MLPTRYVRDIATMEISRFSLLIVVMLLMTLNCAYAGKIVAVDEDFFYRIESLELPVDQQSLDKARDGHIKSRIDVAVQLLDSYNEEGIRLGVRLLEVTSLVEPYAKIKLATVYHEGVYTGGFQPILRNSSQAIYWYSAYIDGPNPLIPELYPLAVSGLGEVLFESGQYEVAFWHLYRNREYVKQDSLGIAQYYLGRLYAEGLGTDRDIAKAYSWFSLSLERGYNAAHLELNFLETEPTLVEPALSSE